MEWKTAFAKEIRRKEQNGDFEKRGELARFLESFAKEHKISAYTARNAYYYDLKKEEAEPEEIGEEKGAVRIQALESKAETSAAVMDKQHLQPGDEARVAITKIVSYGVYVDVPEYPVNGGIIHISNVSTKFVSNLNHYFKVGDELTAKFLFVDEKGKHNFSTKHLQFPEIAKEAKTEAQAVKLSTLKEALQPGEPEEKEHKEVFEYLERHVNMLSPQAKEVIRKLVKGHGMFRFSIALTNALGEFESDLGLLLAKNVEKKLSGGL